MDSTRGGRARPGPRTAYPHRDTRVAHRLALAVARGRLRRVSRRRLDLAHLAPALADFWPSRGPQWDALGLTDAGDILLVEAKAHIGEMCSPPSQASATSRERIALRLEETAAALGARAGYALWIEHFYQLGNRLAHLHSLRRAGVPAWLVLASFVGDDDMSGPSGAAEWRAAYRVVWHVMGLGARHPLSPFVIEVFPAVRNLA